MVMSKELEENERKYNQKKYNDTFIKKNKEKINKKIICDVCCGSYTYYNKSKHNKSAKHINILNKYKTTD